MSETVNKSQEVEAERPDTIRMREDAERLLDLGCNVLGEYDYCIQIISNIIFQDGSISGKYITTKYPGYTQEDFYTMFKELVKLINDNSRPQDFFAHGRVELAKLLET